MSEQNLLSPMIKILSGTPTWVWFTFGYLVVLGIKATKARVVYIPKLFIIPVVLSGLKYKVFLSATFPLLISYFMCLCLATCLSIKFSAKENVKIIKDSISIELPGTYSTVIALISFFVVKYSFGYMKATQPILYQELQILDVSISGVFSGYFLGKAISYLNAYRKLTRKGN